jgi:NAD(P)-dependent dehydrogenase (short-subunit alcohol dehydrogenase family)
MLPVLLQGLFPFTIGYIMNRLARKTALISGAARGIGRAIAELFSREGATVYIGDIDAALGEETAQALNCQQTVGNVPQRVRFIHLDVTDKSSWQHGCRRMIDQVGRIDILVNNAGIGCPVPFENISVEVWEEVMAVNVRGVFLGTQQVLPIMRNQGGGVILNISSVCGLIGHKYSSPAYIASKGAVTMFSRAIASQYARENIRVNSLNPTTADTPMVKKLFEDQAKKKQRIEEVPLGRLATVEDIAYAALYLVSDEAAFITGVAMPVDGGLTSY